MKKTTIGMIKEYDLDSHTYYIYEEIKDFSCNEDLNKRSRSNYMCDITAITDVIIYKNDSLIFEKEITLVIELAERDAYQFINFNRNINELLEFDSVNNSINSLEVDYFDRNHRLDLYEQIRDFDLGWVLTDENNKISTFKEIRNQDGDDLIVKFLTIKDQLTDNNMKINFINQSPVFGDEERKMYSIISSLMEIYKDEINVDNIYFKNNDEILDMLHIPTLLDLDLNQYTYENFFNNTKNKIYILENNQLIKSDIDSNIRLSTGCQELWSLADVYNYTKIKLSDYPNLDKSNQKIAKNLCKLNNIKIVNKDLYR